MRPEETNDGVVNISNTFKAKAGFKFSISSAYLKLILAAGKAKNKVNSPNKL